MYLAILCTISRYSRCGQGPAVYLVLCYISAVGFVPKRLREILGRYHCVLLFLIQFVKHCFVAQDCASNVVADGDDTCLGLPLSVLRAVQND